MNEELRDEVAGVLGEHDGLNMFVIGSKWGAQCSCGASQSCGGQDAALRWHREHRAHALLPLLARIDREARAEAWDDPAMRAFVAGWFAHARNPERLVVEDAWHAYQSRDRTSESASMSGLSEKASLPDPREDTTVPDVARLFCADSDRGQAMTDPIHDADRWWEVETGSRPETPCEACTQLAQALVPLLERRERGLGLDNADLARQLTDACRRRADAYDEGYDRAMSDAHAVLSQRGHLERRGDNNGNPYRADAITSDATTEEAE